MRTLSATLEAAQKKHIGEPVAQVVIDDRHVGVFRPRWEQRIADTVADGPSAVGATYDGAIIRARVDPAEGKLYVQRVSDPASVSQWTAWMLLESDVSTESQIALAWDGNSIQALFFVASDGRTIKVCQSTDNGQTWGSAATVVTLASDHTCRSLAASLNAGSETLYCFYGDEVAATPGQAQIYSTSCPESGGAWVAPQSWGRGDVEITHGLAVDGIGSRFNIAASIANSLYTFLVPVADLGDWPDPTEVLHSDDTDISYRWPAIGLGFGQHYYLFFVEHSAAAETARLNHVITPDWQNVSMLPRPYATVTAYGACAVSDGAHHYLCTSRDVYRALCWGPEASQRVAVSADVHALRLSEHLESAGRLMLALRNDDGRYGGAGQAGTYQAVRLGSQVSVRLGYRTSEGEEVSHFRPYWVTRLVWQAKRRERGESLLVIEAVDGWGIVEAARARQTYVWTDSTVLTILMALLAGLGFAVTDDGAANWSRPLTRFSINPGMSLGEAVRRVLRLAGGHLIWRMDEEWEETWPSAVAHLAVPPPSSSYEFGSDHAIINVDNVLAEQTVTHVIALGDEQETGEAFDWDTIELGNEEHAIIVIDRRLTDADEAGTRAAEELAVWRRSASGGYIIVPPHVGLEILDIITINDTAANLSDAARLVVGNEVVLDRGKGIFEQRLELAGAEAGT